MILNHISILNFKNLEQVELDFSKNINCIIGHNGMGKTNILDAIYYLSFCKSFFNSIDSQNIKHDREFVVVQGFYSTDSGDPEVIYCGLKRKLKKQFKRNKKEYERLSDHIGFIPLIMVSPSDSILISGGSDERRRFMDLVISQYDKGYLEALMKYNKALTQRNMLLKADNMSDGDVMDILEDVMSQTGKVIFEKREKFISEFIPVFQEIYSTISQNKEKVSLEYESHAKLSDLSLLLKESREKDRIMGFSLKGIHKDDLIMELGDFPIKREGSQGQNKTYLIALKLAQFDFLKRTGSNTVPILLLDDIFDKLDATRVEQIVRLVSGDKFGQIFITDTNRDHLDKILSNNDDEYKIFFVEDGNINEITRG